jgi:TIR domain
VNAIFVSYSRTDLSFVHELRSCLVKGGHEVWLDVDAIAPSDDWLASAERALEVAAAVLFVVSPESLRSESCMHELRHAADHGKRMIAVIRSGVADKLMPDELAESESIDALDRDDLAAVLQHLDRTL